MSLPSFEETDKYIESLKNLVSREVSYPYSVLCYVEGFTVEQELNANFDFRLLLRSKVADELRRAGCRRIAIKELPLTMIAVGLK